LFDTDRDGKITLKQMGNAMRAIGSNVKDEELQDRLLEIDIDACDICTYNNFLKLMSKTYADMPDSAEALTEALRKYDVNGTGFITKQDMIQEMINQGEQCQCFALIQVDLVLDLVCWFLVVSHEAHAYSNVQRLGSAIG